MQTALIYLTGCTAPSYEDYLARLGCGLIIRPGSYAPERVTAYPTWAADNGCYPPDLFVPFIFYSWIERVGELASHLKARCLFGLVPDMPFDHKVTSARFAADAEKVRNAGLPVAFALQDGATVDNVPWQDFDVAFIAGSTDWKLSPFATDLVFAARNRGLWVHMGRVNSFRRLDHAATIGCDSADGTFMRFGPPEVMSKRLSVWLSKDQPRLTQR